MFAATRRVVPGDKGDVRRLVEADTERIVDEDPELSRLQPKHRVGSPARDEEAAGVADRCQTIRFRPPCTM
jgi:hypothetical protein